MRKASLLFFLLGGTLVAAEKPVKLGDPMPGATLSVTMGQRTPLRVRVARDQATLISLPDGQRVMNVYGADKGDGGVWAIDAGKVPTRFLAVKPKETGIHTTLHVISNTGQEVSFFLEEVTGKDAHFDAEVDAETESSDTPTITDVKWVPAEEVANCKAKTTAIQADAADATKAAEAKVDATLAAFRTEYPTKIHVDFHYDPKRASRLGFTGMWADDRFTYFKSDQVLALYEIDEDGKPSLIQYSYKDGVYTVPKLLFNGYFAIGPKKQNKLVFHRDRS